MAHRQTYMRVQDVQISVLYILAHTVYECKVLSGYYNWTTEDSNWKQRSRSMSTVIIHAGTDDLGRSVNLDNIMGDTHALVNMAKTKFSQYKLVLSGVLWYRDTSQCHIGALDNEDNWSYICRS
jgi:hypothetical protein